MEVFALCHLNDFVLLLRHEAVDFLCQKSFSHQYLHKTQLYYISDTVGVFFLCYFLGESAVSTEQPLSRLILHETFGEETSLVYFNVPRWRLSDTNGGLRKKWCQSWHCDGSLNSTLVLKVFQVSKNAFSLLRPYERG